jgi:hypothetical protein
VKLLTQFFIVHADFEKEQKMITRNIISKKTCSGATLARVTGVEFCVDMSIPGDEEKTNAPHFPQSHEQELLQNKSFLKLCFW